MSTSKAIEISPEQLNDDKPVVKEIESKEKRMTVKFSAELNEHLQWIAQEQGISQNEAVRKAVALESYLRQALKRPGARLLIEDDSSVREIVIR